jgi:serine/threonine-protein kinase
LESKQPLGDYTLLGELGTHRTGTTYLARAADRRPVVLEVFTPKYFDRQSSVLFDPFRAVHHPHWTEVVAYEEAAGQFFLVMEYLHATALRDTLDRVGPRGVPLGLAARIVASAAAGLQPAHELTEGGIGFVHRAVGPKRVFVGWDGCVKLMPHVFSMAAATDSTLETRSLTRTRDTIAYFSPQQVRGEPVDHRADIYALGVLLYELTVGSLPFARTSTLEMLQAMQRHEIPAPRTLRSDFPEPLEAVVLRALSLDPEARQATAGELASELERWLDAHPEPTDAKAIADFLTPVHAGEIARRREFLAKLDA